MSPSEWWNAIAAGGTLIGIVIILWKGVKGTGSWETAREKDEEGLNRRIDTTESLNATRYEAISNRIRALEMNLDREHGSRRKMEEELRQLVVDMTETSYNARTSMFESTNREIGELRTSSMVAATKIIELERRISNLEPRSASRRSD